MCLANCAIVDFSVIQINVRMLESMSLLVEGLNSNIKSTSQIFFHIRFKDLFDSYDNKSLIRLCSSFYFQFCYRNFITDTTDRSDHQPYTPIKGLIYDISLPGHLLGCVQYC